MNASPATRRRTQLEQSANLEESHSQLLNVNQQGSTLPSSTSTISSLPSSQPPIKRIRFKKSAGGKQKPAPSKAIIEEPAQPTTETTSTSFVTTEGQLEEEEDTFRALAIVDETKALFRIKWEGIDPQTSQPWVDTWEPHSNANESLVDDWKDYKDLRRRGSVPRNRSKLFVKTDQGWKETVLANENPTIAQKGDAASDTQRNSAASGEHNSNLPASVQAADNSSAAGDTSTIKKKTTLKLPQIPSPPSSPGLVLHQSPSTQTQKGFEGVDVSRPEDFNSQEYQYYSQAAFTSAALSPSVISVNATQDSAVDHIDDISLDKVVPDSQDQNNSHPTVNNSNVPNPAESPSNSLVVTRNSTPRKFKASETRDFAGRTSPPSGIVQSNSKGEPVNPRKRRKIILESSSPDHNSQPTKRIRLSRKSTQQTPTKPADGAPVLSVQSVNGKLPYKAITTSGEAFSQNIPPTIESNQRSTNTSSSASGPLKPAKARKRPAQPKKAVNQKTKVQAAIANTSEDTRASELPLPESRVAQSDKQGHQSDFDSEKAQTSSEGLLSLQDHEVQVEKESAQSTTDSSFSGGVAITDLSRPQTRREQFEESDTQLSYLTAPQNYPQSQNFETNIASPVQVEHSEQDTPKVNPFQIRKPYDPVRDSASSKFQTQLPVNGEARGSYPKTPDHNNTASSALNTQQEIKEILEVLARNSSGWRAVNSGQPPSQQWPIPHHKYSNSASSTSSRDSFAIHNVSVRRPSSSTPSIIMANESSQESVGQSQPGAGGFQPHIGVQTRSSQLSAMSSNQNSPQLNLTISSRDRGSSPIKSPTSGQNTRRSAPRSERKLRSSSRQNAASSEVDAEDKANGGTQISNATSSPLKPTDSKQNSSSGSRSNASQSPVETDESVLILPLKLPSEALRCYQDEIIRAAPIFDQFLTEATEHNVRSVKTVFERLHDLETHNDLLNKNNDRPDSIGLASELQTVWDQTVSSKLKFLGAFLESAKDVNKHILIATSGGKRLAILMRFLEGLDRSYTNLETKSGWVGHESSLRLSLTTWTHAQAPSLKEPVDMVIGFDESFVADKSNIQKLRSDLAAPNMLVVSLVIACSLQHVELETSKISSLTEIEVIRRSIFQLKRLARLVGRLPYSFPSTSDALGHQFAQYLSDGNLRDIKTIEDLTETAMAAALAESDGQPTSSNDSSDNDSFTGKRPRASTTSDQQQAPPRKSARLDSPSDKSNEDSVMKDIKPVLEKAPSVDEKIQDLQSQLLLQQKQMEKLQMQHEVTLGGLQQRYEELTLSNSALSKELKANQDLLSTAQTRLEESKANTVTLREERTTLRSDLAAARKALAESSIPEAAAFEALHGQVSQVDDLRRKLVAQEKDAAFMRERYQDASSLAVEHATELGALREKAARLDALASGQVKQLNEMFATRNLEKSAREIGKLRAQTQHRDRQLTRLHGDIDKLTAENRSLREQLERQTGMAAATRSGSVRASSQPPAANVAAALAAGAAGALAGSLRPGRGPVAAGSRPGSRPGSRQASPLPSSVPRGNGGNGVGGSSAPFYPSNLRE